MDRRKLLKRAVRSKVMSNKKSSESDSNSSDKESDNSSLGLLEMFLSLQKTPKRKIRKRRVSKTCKRKGSNHNNATNYTLNGFHSNGPKNCSNCKKKNNCRGSKESISTINLESDEEKVNENIGDSHVRSIENKIDNFFKSANLVSDDDEENVKVVQKDEDDPTSKKTKDFYMVISDSEEEITVGKPSTAADNIIPGSNDIHNISKGNLVAEKNKDELMDLVDSILQPNEDQLQKVSKPDDSWEDYKKKTEEMLGSVTVLIHGLKENNDKMDAPVLNEKHSWKEMTPSCPICLEILGAREAAVTFCGHMFCKTCITRVAKTTRKCPTCRKTLNIKKIHPVYF